ncbi:pilus assembly FimT family protein [Paucibacter soli]|uniref:pilus assembly FimT family protein n=1 Tax=Paucibacter soli TaxID=3133433 RepID=UPI0030965B83
MIPGARAKQEQPASCPPRQEAGFTLIELIVVMVLVGALAVVALPRLIDTNDWRLRAFGDQLLAELPAMQRLALTQRRPIVATITGSGISFAYVAGGALGTLDCPAGASPCIAEGGSRTFTFNAANSGRSVSGSNSSLSITVAYGSYSQAYQLEHETGLVFRLP